MIQTHSLTFQYPKGTHLFNFPDISLKPKEKALILGKSGIGKTTLLHLLAGLLKPTSGQISIGSTLVNSLSNHQLDAFRGMHYGIVFQKKHAVQSLSVIDNLKARLLFSQKKKDTVYIEAMLAQLDILHCKNKKIVELSEGQLQRLGIAMAVIHDPKIILADEPTSSLDDENCHIVMELLIAQAEQTQANLIVITHDERIKAFFPNIISL